MVNIRKIKRDKREYFYLEHTIREGDKFRNKRKYLGYEIPKDIRIIKEKFTNEIFIERFERKLKKIKDNFSRDFLKYPDSAKKKYVESFMIKFTYDSNRIEGSTLSLKETADLLEADLTPRNKPLDDVLEAKSHKEVFYDMLDYKEELNLKVILDWHKTMFKKTKPDIAGVIRKHPVAIARSRAELPHYLEIPFLLKDFFKWYDKNKNLLNPVILASLSHLKFVTIHPFSDGNGRISRIIMNFILKKNNYPMLNIGYKNRNSYYNALERSQLKDNDSYFMLFFVKRYIKEYDMY